MLFNSIEYIFFFLPLVFAITFALNSKGFFTAAKIFLVLASLFFYAWWNPVYLPIMLGSITVNFFISRGLQKTRSKILFALGLLANLGMLGYFKYADFFIANLNAIIGTDFSLLRLLLPLAISFYTFQTVAYLVDCYKGNAEKISFFDFALFISFFPQLIAGPIVHHHDILPQLNNPTLKKINPSNLVRGITLFIIGLAKKVLVADTFSLVVTQGFGHVESLTLLSAWLVSVCFCFQVYYDFSGYSDMAIGAARMFNIELPLNFNAPFRATNLADVWRRWHMTLSRFLRDYIYIPMGGNRKGFARQLLGTFMVFFVGGFWHGAGWLYIIWGAMHGVGMVVHLIWKRLGFTMNKYLAWFLLMLFWNTSLVFFRATSIPDALTVLKKMYSPSDFVWPVISQTSLIFAGQVLSSGLTALILLALCVPLVFYRNSTEIIERLKLTPVTAAVFAVILFITVGNLTNISEFLYFQF